MSTGALVAALVVAAASGARAEEIVFADGRRESVEEPRKDAQGRWTAVQEGRRTLLAPGDVVAVVDGAGKETLLIPALIETPDPPETAAQLSSLRDPKNTAWLDAAQALGARPSRGVLDALVALASDKKKELRARAVRALAQLRTRESVAAATAAVLAEKDAPQRRDDAGLLFSVQEIFKRIDSADAVQKGLADSDPIVRFTFAMLSPRDLEAATKLLRDESLKSGDHHIRESAAVELGHRGDRSGESILIGMLLRTKLPGADCDAGLMDRLMIREQVDVCSILGAFGTDAAKSALGKATSSRLEPVRKAAEAALARKT